MITKSTCSPGIIEASRHANDRKASSSRSSLALIAISAMFMAVVGCQSLPRVDDSSAARAPVQLDGARGPLSKQQSSTILADLKRKSGAEDILGKHIRLVQSKVDSPLVVGNSVSLLQNDAAAYRAMLAAIRSARNNINMETYIFDDDRAGNKFARLLLEKQDQGVQVNLIYDSIGSLNTPRTYFDGLKKHGIRIVEFNPVNPLHIKKRWRINNRDHRKLLVVDGKTVFTGSVNISDTYSSGAIVRSKHNGSSTGQGSGWRDTDIRIEGPVVAEFQKLFIQTWTKQKGPPLGPQNYFPALSATGHDIVLAVGSSYDNPSRVIYVTLISAINSAENYVHLTNAYFVPDRQLIEALEDAAQRGVDVELVLPAKTDSSLALYAGRSHFGDLLEHGVKIFLRQGAIVHSKTAVIDGVWSSVGSTNLDWRSFLHNDEINAVILGSDFAQQMENWFEADRAESLRVGQHDWAQRSPLSRIREWGARLWQYWL